MYLYSPALRATVRSRSRNATSIRRPRLSIACFRRWETRHSRGSTKIEANENGGERDAEQTIEDKEEIGARGGSRTKNTFSKSSVQQALHTPFRSIGTNSTQKRRLFLCVTSHAFPAILVPNALDTARPCVWSIVRNPRGCWSRSPNRLTGRCTAVHMPAVRASRQPRVLATSGECTRVSPSCSDDAQKWKSIADRSRRVFIYQDVNLVGDVLRPPGDSYEIKTGDLGVASGVFVGA
jgi:hypothetical protein